MTDKPMINPLVQNSPDGDGRGRNPESRPLPPIPVDAEANFLSTEGEHVGTGDSHYGELASEGREAQQVRFLQTKIKESNFVFLFGGAQRGKTVVTSSIINFLSSVEAGGKLTPFRLKRGNEAGGDDPGRVLFNKIRRAFAEQRFPLRTTLVGDKEPIYVNVRFAPSPKMDADPISMTFLEMPGEDLEKVDTPDGGYGELPSRINAFFKVKDIKLAFILVTEPATAFEDDQLMASFIDYVCDLDSRFETSRLLLLVTKWDRYEGELSVSEFVAENMRLTFAKLHEPRHSIAGFSIGEVVTMDKQPFLKSFNPDYAKGVVNWLYTEFTGKPLYRLGGFERFSKFIKRWL